MGWSFCSFNICGPSTLLQIKESKKIMLSKYVGCFEGRGQLCVHLCQSMSMTNRLSYSSTHTLPVATRRAVTTQYRCPQVRLQRGHRVCDESFGSRFSFEVFYNQLKRKHFSLKKNRQKRLLFLKRTNFKSWEIKIWSLKFFKWMGTGSINSKRDRVLLDWKIKLDIGELEAL